jgi:hypothetical protein
MKISIKFLLVALLAVSSLSAGDSARNKTNLVLRSQRNNAAAFTTFHNLINIKKEDHFDGYLEATNFYGQTDNGSELGKAFGANGSTQVNIGAISDTATNDANARYLLHLYDSEDFTGQIKFDPKQIVYGTRFDYVQRFDWLVEGLYTAVNIPVLYIANDLNMSSSSSLGGYADQEWISIDDVLSGKELNRYSQTDRQMPLAMAKIDGRQHEIGVGDIELFIGYRLWENKNSHLGVNTGVVFPTSKKPTGEYLWEPRLGYSKWGAIGGFDGSVRLWDAEFQKLMFNYSGQFTYLFEGTEKRTLGLNLDGAALTTDYLTGKVLGHYYLIGEATKGGLQPAANILTRDVDVEMGGKFDAIASIEYTRKKFTFDFGYNFFWRDDETINVQTWTDDTYGIADPAFIVPYSDGEAWTGHPFVITSLAWGSDYNMIINKGDLDTTAAETPSYCSHTFFASLGYIFTHWEYPIMLGWGASYEISTKKTTAGEYYKVWSKIGVAF